MKNYETLGDYQSHEPCENGLKLFAAGATAEVIFYARDICRILIYRSGRRPDLFSYAVVAKPEAVDFALTEDDVRFSLVTDQFELRIEKFPIRFAFYTRDGDPVNADHPSFGTYWLDGETTTCKQLQENERFLGLGGKTGNLDRAGSAYTHWNTDYFGYPTGADPLYTTFPFYMGLHNGLVYGIFLDSPGRTTFNFGASNDRFAYFTAEAGPMNYYFIFGDSPAAVIRAFTALVGRPSLPPLWSLGYHQSRYSYYPAHEVRAVARAFRERDIPADVLYLDIHYMDNFKVFTWDK